MLTIYTLTYNEEKLIEFFINHYRNNFPNCEIIIYDNESTDNTVEIAKKNNCKVITYRTDNKLSDAEYLNIKNNCWKTSESEWVIVCDCDELLEINQEQLQTEANNLVNIIKPTGYSIMNFNDNIPISEMKYGFRDIGFDKCVLFNKNKISEINYQPGAHTCNPIVIFGYNLKYNVNNFRLLHYKYLNIDYTIERHKMFYERLSSNNKQKGWGIHYGFSPESIVKFYNDKKNTLIKIL